MKLRHLSLCLLPPLYALCVQHAAAQVYKLVDLNMINVTGINDSGQVVGVNPVTGQIYNSVVWRDGATTGIYSPAPYGSAIANAINNAGEVAGVYFLQDSVDTRHAFFWKDGVMTDLGTFGGITSTALGINDSGHVTGVAYYPGDTVNHAYLWKANVLTDIGTLGGVRSNGYSINNSGQIVGYSQLPASDTNVHAFLWDDGGMTDLGTMGGSTSLAVAINNQGEAVGQVSPGPTAPAASFIWRGGAMIDLGFLGTPPSIPVGAAVPFDVNDSGVVVGQSSWNNPPGVTANHAFAWENGVMTDLNDVTGEAEGWEITRATGINNRGDIVATGTFGGIERGCLLKAYNILLTEPDGGEFWIAGEKDTIRWISALAPGEPVRLQYSVDSGQTWLGITEGIPADSGIYVWTVPDTFSTKARIRIASLLDSSRNDVSGTFKFKGYILTTISESGDYIGYNSFFDRWGFGNSPEDVWPPSWYNRFDYSGIDPNTGMSYLSGAVSTIEVFIEAKPADHPDWESFVGTFGVGTCYLNTARGIYRPTAVAKWASEKEAWGGSCFGIAVANALAFRYRNNFSAHYLGFPDFTTPFGVQSDTNIIPVINELYTHQLGGPHTEYRAQFGLPKTPTQTINDLKQMLISDDAQIRTFSMLNNGEGGGGHAILAYKLKQNSVLPQLYNIFVYDNSNPGVTDAFIVVDTAQNGGNGSWSFSLWPGWGGSKWIYLRDPTLTYLSQPWLPAADPEPSKSPFSPAFGQMIINVNGRAEVALTDSADRVTGYVDSLMRAEIPGSTPLVVENGSVGPPYGYSLPFNPTRISLSEFPDTVSRVYIFKEDKIFIVGRGGVMPDQTDRMFFDGALSVANPDTGTKRIDLQHIFYGSVRDKVFSARDLGLSQLDSVKLENIPVDGLKLSWFGGAPGSYNLRLELAADTGVGTFTHNLVQIEPNSAQILRPVWTNLGIDHLDIQIDLGNDGTIDDTLTISNDLTSIDDRGSGWTPTEYSLAQNYPNPFNPATTIRYDLPEASHVTLRVFSVLGEEVAVLVDAVQGPGSRSVEWNASGLPSGVYFYRLQADDFVATRKLLLTK